MVGRLLFRSMVGGLVILIATTTLVLAITPTKGADRYPPSTVESFAWEIGASDSARAWLRTAFQPAAETNFQGSINNSKAPNFDYNSVSTNLVKFQLRADSDCDVAILWYACTLYDGDNGWWEQTIYADNEKWCQETGITSGCLDVVRVAMHELGHAAGLARSADNGGNDAHSTESESWTVRAGRPIFYSNAT